MSDAKFVATLNPGPEEVIQPFLDLVNELNVTYGVIGGWAIAAYTPAMLHLDLDVVMAAEHLEEFNQLARNIFYVKEFPSHFDLHRAESDFFIQIHTDSGLQNLLAETDIRTVWGYELSVISLPMLLTSKVQAHSNLSRPRSQRYKDLADVFLLLEAFPEAETHVPESIRQLP